MEIRTDDLCLDVSRLNGPVIMLKCHHMRGNQLWEYDAEVFIQMLQEAKFSFINHIKYCLSEAAGSCCRPKITL